MSREQNVGDIVSTSGSKVSDPGVVTGLEYMSDKVTVWRAEKNVGVCNDDEVCMFP